MRDFESLFSVEEVLVPRYYDLDFLAFIIFSPASIGS